MGVFSEGTPLLMGVRLSEPPNPFEWVLGFPHKAGVRFPRVNEIRRDKWDDYFRPSFPGYGKVTSFGIERHEIKPSPIVSCFSEENVGRSRRFCARKFDNQVLTITVVPQVSKHGHGI